MSDAIGIDRAALAARLDADFARIDVRGRLRLLRDRVPGRIVFTTSFGLEDQALTHLIVESGVDIDFATLDTGRLFPETHALWAETEARYGVRIAGFHPRHDAIQSLVARDGINGFHHSVDARKACCGARKVEPLSRALAGADVWITGLRRDQSATRGGAVFVENDAAHDLIKANPLLDWTRDATLVFARTHATPLNPLHDRGFLSIGCAPCTRAVRPGESERAGRWWWEDDAKKECGLHFSADGRAVRGAISGATAHAS